MWDSLTTKARLAPHTLLGLIPTTGRGPTLKTLTSRLEVSEPAAAKRLAVLERKGFLVRTQRSNAIKAIYPLSIRPSHYHLARKDEGQQSGVGVRALKLLGSSKRRKGTGWSPINPHPRKEEVATYV